jgi:hypothetical protein
MYFQLDTCCERSELAAMILLDNEGYSVAESGDESLLEALQLEVEKQAKVHAIYEGSLSLEDRTEGMYMEGFEADGNRFFVGAAGGDADKRKHEVLRAREGIGRILSES